MAAPTSKDHWTATAYTTSAPFVPRLTSTILSWLDAQPTDTILDLGCGDGILTSQIRSSCTFVTGLDASPNLITAAKSSYGTMPNLTFLVQDCRHLEHAANIPSNYFTKVFSNAALHWILRDASTRLSVLKGAYKALQPGGLFVFEMGGAGNVAEVHTALLAALVHHGVSIQQAREASPWFFPSEELMRGMLEEAGFVVERMQVEWRPTELTMEEGGGLEGWVRLMGARFLEVVEVGRREDVVGEVCEVLETVVVREEGRRELGYVRLRGLARKV